MNEVISNVVPPRSQRLKSATHGTHDRLDKRIMAADIFADREQFVGFLRVQYRFHRDIAPLYDDPALAALIPELGERARLLRIANDLSSLGHVVPNLTQPPAAADLSLYQALGWLYVAEGSNLGGTVLFKLARERLGLNQQLGANHLAAHPEGAARHWRQFTAALDAVPMNAAQEQDVITGAERAFTTVRGYVEQELPQVGDVQFARQ
ncbi:Heme oxygenase [compost metagenome]